MKEIKEVAKITVKKSNSELFNFCGLAFKIMKDDPTTKIINLKKKLYVVAINHAMKLYINKESRFMDDVLFESAGYYHLSKNADNSYELTFDKAIIYDAFTGKFNNFEEELIISKIDNIIDFMDSPKICQFTKVSDLKVATIASTLGLWVKDNDVKYLNVLSPVEGFKYENMLILEHCIETGPAEVTHTYLIMNFDNSVVKPDITYDEQMSLALDDHPEENLQDEKYLKSTEAEDEEYEDYPDSDEDEKESFDDVETEEKDIPKKLISFFHEAGYCPNCQKLIHIEKGHLAIITADDRCPHCDQKLIRPVIKQSQDTKNTEPLSSQDDMKDDIDFGNQEISKVIEEIDNEQFDDSQFDGPTF